MSTMKIRELFENATYGVRELTHILTDVFGQKLKLTNKSTSRTSGSLNTNAARYTVEVVPVAKNPGTLPKPGYTMSSHADPELKGSLETNLAKHFDILGEQKSPNRLVIYVSLKGHTGIILKISIQLLQINSKDPKKDKRPTNAAGVDDKLAKVLSMDPRVAAARVKSLLKQLSVD